MPGYFRRFLPGLVFASLAGMSCSRRAGPEELRLGVAHLENLTANPALDWQSRLAAAVLAYDLNGVGGASTLGADSFRPAYDPRVNRVLQGYFSLDRGLLTVHATLESPLERKTLRLFVEQGPLEQGVTPLLDRVAKALRPGARTFPARDPGALNNYSDALASADPAIRSRLLLEATGREPSFTPAYIQLAGALLAQDNRAAAGQAAATGKSTASGASDIAQLDYLAASAAGDSAARTRALESLARLNPGDPEVWRTAGEGQALQRDFPKAIQDYEVVAKLTPEDPLVYNLLGYLHGYEGQLDLARAAFKKYQDLAGPGDANPLDSLGEVYFLNGDFPAAERAFLEAHDRNPAAAGGRELLKAAQARLLAGDLAGADSLFNRSLAASPETSGQAVEMERAQWEFLTGRRRGAMARLDSLIGAGGDVAAFAGSQLSVWRLQTGDRAGAVRLAVAATGRAVSPGTKKLAAICRFLAESNAPSSTFASINAIVLVLHHRFAEAIQPLEALYRQTHPSADAPLRTLLAWCYVETGRAAQARTLVDRYPIPLPSSEPQFTALVFPRFLQVRAAVLRAEQKTVEARRMQQLYDQYSGDVPDRF